MSFQFNSHSSRTRPGDRWQGELAERRERILRHISGLRRRTLRLAGLRRDLHCRSGLHPWLQEELGPHGPFHPSAFRPPNRQYLSLWTRRLVNPRVDDPDILQKSELAGIEPTTSGLRRCSTWLSYTSKFRPRRGVRIQTGKTVLHGRRKNLHPLTSTPADDREGAFRGSTL